MDSVSMERAFASFGVPDAGKRSLCATAEDGSFVLVCLSSGFSRPDAGVLRYSSILSQTDAGKSWVEKLRAGLVTASAGQSPVRLIIHTRGAGRVPARVHVRPDLIGSITGFDGDTYSVDFVRPPVEEPEPPARGRRKR